MSGKLQWGHAFSDVETGARARCARAGDAASMGPRLFGRGNTPATGDHCDHRRGFNGATPFRTWKLYFLRQCVEASIALQWGHAFSDVETSISAPSEGPGE